MEPNETISVEVIYIEPNSENSLKLDLVKGSNIEQAIKTSGLLDCFPEIDLSVNKVGIFSKIQTLDTILQSGDRVEIYRPLLADPKEARRQRAKKK
ncbi:MAG: RnfH family protein [Proteobacteria bacterium]|nr:RnfH family protein [Pseudomonadota bacterium]NOG61198.1 RnfH family protein [Pseudomonadota bacterium]